MSEQQLRTSFKTIPVQKLSVYQNAIAFFTLSRKLHYKTYNFKNQHANSLQLTKSHYDKITDAALTLPYAIAQATVTRDYSKKIILQKTIGDNIDKLKISCGLLHAKENQKTTDWATLKQLFKNLEKSYHLWSLEVTRQN